MWVLFCLSGIFQQQRQRHLAPFGSQDVVGAAGGQAVHGLDADTAPDQALQQAGVRKAQPLAAAKQHQLVLWDCHRFEAIEARHFDQLGESQPGPWALMVRLSERSGCSFMLASLGLGAKVW